MLRANVLYACFLSAISMKDNDDRKNLNRFVVLCFAELSESTHWIQA